MPPGFMSANCAPNAVIASSWPSAMAFPSVDSSTTWAWRRSAWIWPMTAFRMPSTMAAYFAMIAVSAGSFGTSRVTIRLSTAIEKMSLVFGSILRSIFVTSRPNDAALDAGTLRPTALGRLQLYYWWVWPVITRSTASSSGDEVDQRAGRAVAGLGEGSGRGRLEERPRG